MFINYIFGSAGRAEPFKSADPLAGSMAFGTRVGLLPIPVRLQKPPTAAALPADPSQNLRAFAPWPPQAANFQTFGRLFADQKSIKNLTPQKATQNLKNLTPERPNVDFGVTFGVNFGIDFHDFSTFSKNCESLNNIVKL